MKKISYLMLMFALLFMGTVCLNAQVTIGSQENPHSGSVLDLSQVPGKNLGFLLPNVALDSDLTKFVLNGEVNKATATGMLVYNTTDSKVYFWNGSTWGLLSGHGTTTPEITLSSISVTGTPSKTTYTAGESFAPAGLTVTATYSDGSKVNVSSSATFTPNPLTAGTTQVTANYGGKTAVVSTPITVAAATNADGSTTMTINGKPYKTYDYNGTVWMVQNSSEGTAARTGSNGNYYTWEDAPSACPSGWVLPNQTQWEALKSIVNANLTTSGKWWTDNSYGAFAGYYYVNDTKDHEGSWGSWWAQYSEMARYSSSVLGIDSIDIGRRFWLSVRCVKN